MHKLLLFTNHQDRFAEFNAIYLISEPEINLIQNYCLYLQACGLLVYRYSHGDIHGMYQIILCEICPYPVCPQSTTVKGLYYPMQGNKSRSVFIPALSHGSEQYPVLQPIMGRMEELDIQKTVVHVTGTGNRQYSFEIHFRYSSTFGSNPAVRSAWNDMRWFGDIAVMQRGDRIDIVNITTAGERKLAQSAVRRYEDITSIPKKVTHYNWSRFLEDVQPKIIAHHQHNQTLCFSKNLTLELDDDADGSDDTGHNSED